MGEKSTSYLKLLVKRPCYISIVKGTGKLLELIALCTVVIGKTGEQMIMRERMEKEFGKDGANLFTETPLVDPFSLSLFFLPPPFFQIMAAKTLVRIFLLF